jgi:hypothetical protein
MQLLCIVTPWISKETHCHLCCLLQTCLLASKLMQCWLPSCSEGICRVSLHVVLSAMTRGHVPAGDLSEDARRRIAGRETSARLKALLDTLRRMGLLRQVALTRSRLKMSCLLGCSERQCYCCRVGEN